MKNIDLGIIFREDAERKRQKVKDHRELTFKDYLELLEQDPKLAENSPARLLEIILGAGVEEIPEDERVHLDNGKLIATRYKLFSERLFGLDRSIYQVVKYLEAGARRLSTGKQILLLVGPTASGKSTFVNILKRALEGQSVRHAYAIKGCPMREDPLHLLPRHLRKQFEEKLGVHIEGDLCPVCRHRLNEEFREQDGVVRWWDVPVETFTFSVSGTRGIGSFEPSDPKSQDVGELVGRENIAVSTTKGPDHPLAYTLSGELEKANRGICEGRELIKADEKILWVFISVAEEKEIKVQGSSFPHISVDVVVVGHTNLTEFAKFAGRKENEALHDRMYVVPFPYPLRIADEVAIYRKLIERESDMAQFSSVHIAPGSLELAALFAVMSRLAESRMGVDLLTKVKVYNGDRAIVELQGADKRPIDLRTLVEEGQSPQEIVKREGMFGVSSRDVLAALNTQLVKSDHGCLTPLSVIRALREVFEHRMGYTPEEIERFKELLSAGEGGSVMAEYREYVIKTVTKAFLRAYDDLARELFRKYLEEAAFYRDQKRKFVRGSVDIRRDDMTGKPKEPDVRFLRSVEQHIPISEAEADMYRGEVLEGQSRAKHFDFDTYRPLAIAVEKKLLQDTKSALTLVLDPDRPKDETQKKRAQTLFDELRSGGFCEVCAREFIEKAAEFLNR